MKVSPTPALPQWFRDQPLGRKTVGEQLDRQPRFAVRYNAPQGAEPARVVLEPLTPAAQSLMNKPIGVRLQDQVGALISSAHIPAGSLRGITLSTGRDGLAINKFVSDAELGYQNIPSDSEDFLGTIFTGAALSNTRKQIIASDKSGAKAFGGPWLHLGPQASRVMLNAAADKQVTDPAVLQNNYVMSHLLRHEAQHAVTPANDKTYPRYAWLEEATAETIGRWPGAIKRTAQGLGIPVKVHSIQQNLASSEGGAQYNAWSGSLRSLLRLAGINTMRTDSLPQAVELLQTPALSRVPGKLADAIVANNKLDPSLRETIREFIVQTQGSPDSINSLVDFVHSHRS